MSEAIVIKIVPNTAQSLELPFKCKEYQFSNFCTLKIPFNSNFTINTEEKDTDVGPSNYSSLRCMIGTSDSEQQKTKSAEKKQKTTEIQQDLSVRKITENLYGIKNNLEKIIQAKILESVPDVTHYIVKNNSIEEVLLNTLAVYIPFIFYNMIKVEVAGVRDTNIKTIPDLFFKQPEIAFSVYYSIINKPDSSDKIIINSDHTIFYNKKELIMDFFGNFRACLKSPRNIPCFTSSGLRYFSGEYSIENNEKEFNSIEEMSKLDVLTTTNLHNNNEKYPFETILNFEKDQKKVSGGFKIHNFPYIQINEAGEHNLLPKFIGHNIPTQEKDKKGFFTANKKRIGEKNIEKQKYDLPYAFLSTQGLKGTMDKNNIFIESTTKAIIQTLHEKHRLKALKTFTKNTLDYFIKNDDGEPVGLKSDFDDISKTIEYLELVKLEGLEKGAIAQQAITNMVCMVSQEIDLIQFCIGSLYPEFNAFEHVLEFLNIAKFKEAKNAAILQGIVKNISLLKSTSPRHQLLSQASHNAACKLLFHCEEIRKRQKHTESTVLKKDQKLSRHKEIAKTIPLRNSDKRLFLPETSQDYEKAQPLHSYCDYTDYTLPTTSTYEEDEIDTDFICNQNTAEATQQKTLSLAQSEQSPLNNQGFDKYSMKPLSDKYLNPLATQTNVYPNLHMSYLEDRYNSKSPYSETLETQNESDVEEYGYQENESTDSSSEES